MTFSKRLFAFLCLLLASPVVFAQGTYTWNAANSGGTGGNGTGWIRNSGNVGGASENWIGGAAGKVPGVDQNNSTIVDGNANDVAMISITANTFFDIGMSNSTANGVTGNGQANGRLTVGAVVNTSPGGFASSLRASSLAPTLPGYLQLNGAYAGNTGGVVTNTLIAATGGNININRVNNTNLLDIQLGIDGGFITAAAGRTINLTSYVGETAGGAKGFTKDGAGTLTMSGINTYTGTTNINGGTLNGNTLSSGSNSATGTGIVNINNGGTLAGTGSAVGAVNVNSGGRLVGGLGTAVNETLTVGTTGTNATTFDVGSFYRAAVAEGSGAADLSLTGASRVAFQGQLEVTVALLSSTGGSQANSLNLELVGTGLTNFTQYQRTIGTYGSLGPVLSSAGTAITLTPGDQATITPVGFEIDQSNWSIAIANNNVVITFTPVPEPVTILGITAFGAFTVGGLRRRFARSA
jgi:fibronectin-binding autotransporter adhesin